MSKNIFIIIMMAVLALIFVYTLSECSKDKDKARKFIEFISNFFLWFWP